ncbi:MAG TPA: succinate dehydrogenase iron-sulfur subunit [Planctomycetota bacterium]|jgi:succinate dehydrogenase / fumarate reductase iron-sulfur subunit
MEARQIEVSVKRCAGPGQPSYWDTFKVAYAAGMNVIMVLQELRRNPVTIDGKKVMPPAYDCSCLEEVCGACSMLVNGKARQACTALVDKLEHPISLAPLTKFPIVRDLAVDRSFMFENLKKVKAWVPIDGTYNLGPGPRLSFDESLERYVYSKCMTCGCCLESCPQVHGKSTFMGAAPIAQVKLMNMHPTGKLNASERLDALMGPGGIGNCGNAQNCVEACPKEIPLSQAIADMQWDTTKRWIGKLFTAPAKVAVSGPAG